jgi:hypothetical protein
VGGDKLAELAAELLLRGVDAETVAKVLGRGGEASSEEEPRGRRKHWNATKKPTEARFRYVTHTQVLAAMERAGRPLSRPELVKLLPDSTAAAIGRHLTRGLGLGNVVQVSKVEPHTFALTKSGKLLVKQESAHKPVPLGHKGLPHETVMEKLRQIGPCTANALRRAVGMGSDQSIRMHLLKGVTAGEVARHDDRAPIEFSAIGGAAKKKPIGPPLTKRGTPRIRSLPAKKEGKRGKSVNLPIILAALKKARKPLDREGFAKVSPAFRAMSLAAQYVALGNAVKSRHVKRVGSGVYALADGVSYAAPKEPKPRAERAAKSEAAASAESAASDASVTLN